MGPWVEFSFFVLFFHFLRYILMPCIMYLLPVAAVTNCHKFKGLKEQKLILSQFWKPKSKVSVTGSKSSCRQGCAPPRDSKGRIRSFSFREGRWALLGLWSHYSKLCLHDPPPPPLLQTLPPPRLCVSFSFSVCIKSSRFLPTRTLMFALRAHTDNTEPSSRLKSLSFITSEKTFLPCKVTFIGSGD